jgi:D-alanyl-D-alanine carboxypeptidase
VWAARELVAHAAQFPLLFEPGTPGAFDYSSTNYVILGMIAEQVTGRPFAQEMRARIFEPLNLESTYFAPDDAVLGTAARGYGGEFDQTDISLSFAFATANIVSTPENVMRFGQALQRGELLDHATMAQMFTFVNGLGQYNMPALEYGLGIMRNQLAVGPNASGAPRDTATRTVMGHIGGFGGFRSAMWTTPDGEITIALGMNQGAADPNILATGVFDAVLRSLGR